MHKRYARYYVMMTAVILLGLASGTSFAGIAVGEGAPKDSMRRAFESCYSRPLGWGSSQSVYLGHPVNTVHQWGDGWVQDFSGGKFGDGIVMLRTNKTTAFAIWGDSWRLYKENPMRGTNPPSSGLDWLGYPMSDIRPPTAEEAAKSLWPQSVPASAVKAPSIQVFRWGYIAYGEGKGAWHTKTENFTKPQNGEGISATARTDLYAEAKKVAEKAAATGVDLYVVLKGESLPTSQYFALKGFFPLIDLHRGLRNFSRAIDRAQKLDAACQKLLGRLRDDQIQNYLAGLSGDAGDYYSGRYQEFRSLPPWMQTQILMGNDAFKSMAVYRVVAPDLAGSGIDLALLGWK